MMKSANAGSKRFFLFLFTSALIHLVILAVLFLGPRYLFLSELNHRLDHTIENKTEDLITQIELINNEQTNKQVVEQSEKSVNQEMPKDAEYLSATNQKVEKETKARNNGKFNNSSAPGVSQISVGQKSKTENKSQKSKIKDLGLNGLPIDVTEKDKSKSEKDSPTVATFGSGLSQTDDYLDDVEEGDQTLLNTKEFIYYSYFMRVKDQLRSHWNPKIRQNVQVLYAKDRNLANLNVKATSVRVTLDKQGYLEKIELLKTSGYHELDISAIQAFRSAAPFLNPPTGLLEKDKRIRIVWDFILES